MKNRPVSYAAIWAEIAAVIGDLRDLQEAGDVYQLKELQKLIIAPIQTPFGPRVDMFFQSLPEELGFVNKEDCAKITVLRRDSTASFSLEFIGTQGGFVRAATDLQAVPGRFFREAGPGKYIVEDGVQVYVGRIGSGKDAERRMSVLERIEKLQFGEFKRSVPGRSENQAFFELQEVGSQRLLFQILGIVEPQGCEEKFCAKELRRDAHFLALTASKLYLTEQQLDAIQAVFTNQVQIISGVSSSGKLTVAAVSAQLLNQYFKSKALWSVSSAQDAENTVCRLRQMGLDAVSFTECSGAGKPFTLGFLVQRKAVAGEFVDRGRLRAAENASLLYFYERVGNGEFPGAFMTQSPYKKSNVYQDTRSQQDYELGRILSQKLQAEEAITHTFLVGTPQDLYKPWFQELRFQVAVLSPAAGEMLEVDQLQAVLQTSQRVLFLEDPATGLSRVPAVVKETLANRTCASRLKQIGFHCVNLQQEFKRHPGVLEFVRQNGFPETINKEMKTEYLLTRRPTPGKIASLLRQNVLTWFRIDSGEAEIDGPRVEYVNPGEAQAAFLVVQQLLNEYELDVTEMCIVTTYLAQKQLIKEKLQNSPDMRLIKVLLPHEVAHSAHKIAVGSLVDSNAFGYLRENVGLETIYNLIRAASSLCIILGSVETHGSDTWWRLLLEYLEGRQSIFNVPAGLQEQQDIEF